MKIYTDENNKIVVDSFGKIHTDEPFIPGVITDGLLMWLDGEDSPSGGYWMDKQGTYNCTIEGNVTHETNNGGVYRIGTSGTDHLYNSSIDMTSGAFTIMGGGRYLTTSGGGRLYSNVGGPSNFALGWSNNVLHFYENGWVGNGGEATTDWNIMTISNNSSRNNGKWLRNNTDPPAQAIYGGTVKSNLSGPLGISFGNESSGGGFSEHSNCEIGFYLVYNRQLSTEEMTQNYNYYKDRYGL